MPKYWQQIAIEAQAAGREYYDEACELRAAGEVKLWATCMELAALAYARARWAMTVPDDCP